MASKKDTETETTDRKRKQDGGSTGVSPNLKKHYSVTSGKDDSEFDLGAIPEIDLPTCNRTMNYVADRFTDEAFIKKISPTLVTISQPLTNAAINEAVAQVVLKLENDVKPLQKQNDTLSKAIAKENETNEQKDEIIMAKDELLKQRNDTIMLRPVNSMISSSRTTVFCPFV